jgi:hypothetical protein
VNLVLPSLKWPALLLLGIVLTSPLNTRAAQKAEPIPPVIHEQPIGRTATAGGHVVLSVAAHGTSPLQYQWFTGHHTVPVADSARISGSTNSVLNIEPALTGDSGGYSVVISSSGGATTSLVANVAVNVLSVIPTATGATGVIVQLTGQIGDVYRMELNENFTGFKTNGYATNVNGTARYTYRWPSDSLIRQRRETVDRVLPVLSVSNSAPAPRLRAYGKLNQVWRFQGTTNFVHWDNLITVTNTNGWMKFNDVVLQSPPRRFYRITPP